MFPLTQSTRELLDIAIERYEGSERRAFFDQFADRPSARVLRGSGSRQARHARMTRTRAAAVAAAVLVATEHRSLTDRLFAPDFAALRPYSFAAFSRFQHLLAAGARGRPAGWKRIWERGSEVLLELGPRTARLETSELLVCQAALAVLIGAVVAGGAGEDDWSRLWARAGRAGLLRNRYFQMMLSSLGASCGRWEPHLEWILDPSNLPIEMTDTYLFVRRDKGPELVEQIGRLVRGETPQLDCGLYPHSPLSTMRNLLDFARMAMRSAYHFRGPSTALMVLSWVDQIARDAQRLRETSPNLPGFAALEEGFKRLENVQVMEKARFWKIVSMLPPGEARSRLEELWGRSYRSAAA